ncbi:hypothetical protein [Pararhodobacter sp.]|jgi:hypothetical protein|uniref:hypothetical protein n=1 Tax=Pararhodobacter sp. TaxID=2127056 RepID=UPI002FDCEA86
MSDLLRRSGALCRSHFSRNFAPLALSFIAATAAALSGAQAQEQGEGAALRIELNRTELRENACQLVFVAQNDTAEGLSQLVLEMVLFDRSGGVAALTLLDFQELPAGRMRVRSFDMPGLECDALGRVLVNDTASCAPQGAPGCTDFTLSSRLDGIEVLQ